MNKDSLSYDILKEIFNIGVGKAADLLSQMLNKRIIFDVPSIDIIEGGNQYVSLTESLSKGFLGTLMVSSIAFQDELTGEANLVFPSEKMRAIIDLCLGEQYNPAEDIGFTDIDFDVIREIGNIILNSIIGEMGNFLKKEIEYTLPNVKLFEMIDFEDRIKNLNDRSSLLLSISFIIDGIEIEGAVILNFALNSLKIIIKTLEDMEEELYG